ncbi:MAG: hypothetical protein WCJ02_03205 [bacterium]
MAVQSGSSNSSQRLHLRKPSLLFQAVARVALARHVVRPFRKADATSREPPAELER